jgi:hypothetical protein
MSHNIVANIFETFCTVIILYTLYVLYISFVLSFTSHPTVFLTNLWIDRMDLFIYFHAGLRL